ncbi:MAG TPA: autotransporter-associated beta strand repeat-containing protein, partial [Tepidisphaeraceae bacterium]|nr:autotransporter-associated beta strand repeat-containing protein [Tepidisphaeraceae bacterium]
MRNRAFNTNVSLVRFNTRQMRRLARLIYAAAPVAMVPFLFSTSATAQTVPGISDTWVGGASSTNWSGGSNWFSGVPTAGDSLVFDGTNSFSNDDILALTLDGGITFNSTASAFAITANAGTDVFLTGPLYLQAPDESGTSYAGGETGYVNGITNNSGLTQTENLNLSTDWGYYTFGSPGGGTLAMNGSLAVNTGGLALFDLQGGAITSTSMTTDSSGLISGLGAAGMMYNFVGSGGANGNGYVFSGLATVNNGQVVPYTYAAANVLTAAGTIGAATAATAANIELTATAAGNYPLANNLLGSVTFINTILLTNNTTNKLVLASANGTLDLGTVNGVGGIYLPNGVGGQGLTIGGGATTILTAGPETGPASPGEIILAINGTNTSNEAELNALVANNGSGGAVTLVKTGAGSMYINSGITNSFTGGLYIDQGYLQANSPVAVGTGPIYIAAGATFYPNAAGVWTNNIFIAPGFGSPVNTYGAMRPGSNGTTFTGVLTVTGNPVTATNTPSSTGAGDRISDNGNAAIIAWAGQITGTGTLDLYANAAGCTFVLNNTNTSTPNNWTGGLLIDGTSGDVMDVQTNANNQLADTDVDLNQNGSGTARLDLYGTTQTIGALNSGPVNTGSNNNVIYNSGGAKGTLAAVLTIGADNINGTFGGLIADNSANSAGATLSIVKIGQGTEVLTNNNTFAGGITINGGVIQTTNQNALGSGGLTVNNGGALDVDGNTIQLLGNLAGSSGGIITNSSTNNAQFNIGGTGNSTYAGIIQDGAQPGSLQTSYTGVGTLTLSGNNTASTLSINAANQNGTGALVIGGASNFASTTVQSGALVVNGSLASNGTVSLTNGNSATLSGSGHVGNVMLNSSAEILPGAPATPGTLSMASLNVGGGTLLYIPTASSTGELSVSGQANFNGATLYVELQQGVRLAPGSYTLLSSGTLNAGQPGSSSGQEPTIFGVNDTRQGFTFSFANNQIVMTAGSGTAANLVWNPGTNNNGDAWDLVSTQNWLNSGNSQQDYFYNLDSVSFTGNGGAANSTISLNGNSVEPGSITVNSSVNYVFQNGSIYGAGGLTKA